MSLSDIISGANSGSSSTKNARSGSSSHNNSYNNLIDGVGKQYSLTNLSVEESFGGINSNSKSASRTNSNESMLTGGAGSSGDRSLSRSRGNSGSQIGEHKHSGRRRSSKRPTDVIADMEAFEEEMQIFHDVPDSSDAPPLSSKDEYDTAIRFATRNKSDSSASENQVSFSLLDPSSAQSPHSMFTSNTSQASDSSSANNYANAFMSDSSMSSTSSAASIVVLSAVIGNSEKHSSTVAGIADVLDSVDEAKRRGRTLGLGDKTMSPRDRFLQRPPVKLERRNTLPVRLDLPAAPSTSAQGRVDGSVSGNDLGANDTSRTHISRSSSSVHGNSHDLRSSLGSQDRSRFRTLQHVHSMPRWIMGGDVIDDRRQVIDDRRHVIVSLDSRDNSAIAGAGASLSSSSSSSSSSSASSRRSVTPQQPQHVLRPQASSPSPQLPPLQPSTVRLSRFVAEMMITDIFDEGSRGVYGVHASPSVSQSQRDDHHDGNDPYSLIPSAIPLLRTISAPAGSHSPSFSSYSSRNSSHNASPIYAENRKSLSSLSPSPTVFMPQLPPNIAQGAVSKHFGITSPSGSGNTGAPPAPSSLFHVSTPTTQRPASSSPQLPVAPSSPQTTTAGGPPPAPFATPSSSITTPKLSSSGHKSLMGSRTTSFRAGGGVEVALERSVQVLDGSLPVFTHKIALIYKQSMFQAESDALLLDSIPVDKKGPPLFYSFMLALGALCSIDDIPFQAGLDTSEPYVDGEVALVSATVTSLVVFHTPLLMNPRGSNEALTQLQRLVLHPSLGFALVAEHHERLALCDDGGERWRAEIISHPAAVAAGSGASDLSANDSQRLSSSSEQGSRRGEYRNKLLDRKRLVGNDYVHVVFYDAETESESNAPAEGFDWFAQNICQVVIIVHLAKYNMTDLKLGQIHSSSPQLTVDVIVRATAPTNIQFITGKYVSMLSTSTCPSVLP
jgi:hypothetical protein